MAGSLQDCEGSTVKDAGLQRQHVRTFIANWGVPFARCHVRYRRLWRGGAHSDVPYLSRAWCSPAEPVDGSLKPSDDLRPVVRHSGLHHRPPCRDKNGHQALLVVKYGDGLPKIKISWLVRVHSEEQGTHFPSHLNTSFPRNSSNIHTSSAFCPAFRKAENLVEFVGKSDSPFRLTVEDGGNSGGGAWKVGTRSMVGVRAAVVCRRLTCQCSLLRSLCLAQSCLRFCEVDSCAVMSASASEVYPVSVVAYSDWSPSRWTLHVIVHSVLSVEF